MRKNLASRGNFGTLLQHSGVAFSCVKFHKIILEGTNRYQCLGMSLENFHGDAVKGTAARACAHLEHRKNTGRCTPLSGSTPESRPYKVVIYKVTITCEFHRFHYFRSMHPFYWKPFDGELRYRRLARLSPSAPFIQQGIAVFVANHQQNVFY
nr:MAG: hypothetical protein [Rhabdoviridae sp.]